MPKSTPTNGIIDIRKVGAHTSLVQEMLVEDNGVVEAASAKGVELPWLFMSEQEVVVGLQYPISEDKGNKCVQFVPPPLSHGSYSRSGESSRMSHHPSSFW